MPTDIKLSGLDVINDKGIGIDLPMFISYGSQFAINYTTIDQAAANTKNLLLTNQGERIMQPSFGCDLYRTLFDNETEELYDIVKSKIKQQMEYWLSYIFINDLNVYGDEDYNTMYVNLKISLKNNTLDTRSVQLEIQRESAR